MCVTSRYHDGAGPPLLTPLLALQVSWAHPIDRSSAITLTALQLYKVLYLMLPAMTALELVWLVSSLGLGLSFKVAGYHALLAGDAESFRRNHTLWHMSFPLAFGLHTSVLWYLCAGNCSVASSP